MGANNDNPWNAGSAVITLQVEGMDCTSCEQRVCNVLRRVEGVRDATADHVSGLVEVVLSGEGADPEMLSERIARAGYRVAETLAPGSGPEGGAER